MSQIFSAWKSPGSEQFDRAQLEQNLKLPDLGPMARGPLEQNNGLQYFIPSTTAADVAFQGKIKTNSQVGEFFKLPCPFGNYPYPTENLYFKNSPVSFPHAELRVLDNPICAPKEKKLLIFDRSGNHTRLFLNPSLSSNPNKFIASSSEKVDDRLLSNPVVEEKWDENDLDEEEGELRENSEEIDALLYSDSDDDDDDDDEVTSMRLIPSILEHGSPKRQRLLGGGYKKSSWLSFQSPVDLCNYKGGGDESRNLHDGTNSSERDKKVRIREALKVLVSIIPGLKTENPVSVIEKAIAYLESMKMEAAALGLTCPERKLVDSTSNGGPNGGTKKTIKCV